MKNQDRISKLGKLFKLLELLGRPKGASIPTLTEELGCDRKTIYRLFEDLDELGIPNTVESDLDGNTNSKLRKVDSKYLERYSGLLLRLDEKEQFLLRYLLKRDDLVSDGGLKKVLQGLKMKLDKLLVLETGTSFPAVFSSMKHRKTYEGKEKIFESLLDAVSERREADVVYRSAGGNKEKEFRLHAYTILEYAGGFYVIGRVPDYEDIRTFALERFSYVKVTRTTFDVPASYDPATYLDGAFGIVLGEEPLSVRIHFNPRCRVSVEGRTLGKNQIIETLDDETFILSFTASGRDELKAWIRAFGPDAELLEPKDLRAEIAAELEEAARQYDKS